MPRDSSAFKISPVRRENLAVARRAEVREPLLDIRFGEAPERGQDAFGHTQHEAARGAPTLEVTRDGREIPPDIREDDGKIVGVHREAREVNERPHRAPPSSIQDAIRPRAQVRSAHNRGRNDLMCHSKLEGASTKYRKKCAIPSASIGRSPKTSLQFSLGMRPASSGVAAETPPCDKPLDRFLGLINLHW